MQDNQYKGPSTDEVQREYKKIQKIPGAGEIWRIRPDRRWGPPSLLLRLLQDVKRPGRGVNHPPTPSSAEVKEKVELYFCRKDKLDRSRTKNRGQ